MIALNFAYEKNNLKILSKEDIKNAVKAFELQVEKSKSLEKEYYMRVINDAETVNSITKLAIQDQKNDFVIIEDKYTQELIQKTESKVKHHRELVDGFENKINAIEKNDLYQDPVSKLNINDIFVDFLNNNAETINSILFKKSNSKKL